jgi:hypothetical protein
VVVSVTNPGQEPQTETVPDGAAGPTGPAGADGQNGATGPTGAVGPTGPQGTFDPSGFPEALHYAKKELALSGRLPDGTTVRYGDAWVNDFQIERTLDGFYGTSAAFPAIDVTWGPDGALIEDKGYATFFDADHDELPEAPDLDVGYFLADRADNVHVVDGGALALAVGMPPPVAGFCREFNLEIDYMAPGNDFTLSLAGLGADFSVGVETGTTLASLLTVTSGCVARFEFRETAVEHGGLPVFFVRRSTLGIAAS